MTCCNKISKKKAWGVPSLRLVVIASTSANQTKCRNCNRVISPGVQPDVNPWKGRDWTIKSSRSLTRNITVLKMI